MRVLRGFRSDSECCRAPAPTPVDPALTTLWRETEALDYTVGSARRRFPQQGQLLLSPNIVSESGSTGFVEGLVKLQAEVAGDDSFWISVVPPRMKMR